MENNTLYYPFLNGSGEMAERIRNYNWNSTPVGPVENWPQTLRATLSLMLSSNFPMFLWWGNNLIQFYNDAYRPILGDNGKHPKALGQDAKSCWPEIWDYINPLIHDVLETGEPLWKEDQLVPIYRNGTIEDIYWTFSYSPIRDDDGVITGVLCLCNEVTSIYKQLQDLEKSTDELEFAIEASNLGTWDLNPATGNFKGNDTLKEWFGLRPEQEIPLSAATDVILEKDRARVLDAISRALEPDSGGRYSIRYTIKNPITGIERSVKAKGQAWFKDNIPYRFMGTLLDISDSVKAQEEVAHANQLADLAIKGAGMGLFRVDMQTGDIDYTPAFALALTGDPEKKFISRREFVKHVHPDDLMERAAALESGAATNEFYYTPRVIWEDGTVHRISVVGSNTLDEFGNATAFSGVVRDITLQETQRLALEEASRFQMESDAKFRNVTDSSPTGLWLCDIEGKITYVNKILIEWTGLAFDQFVGREWSDIVIGEGNSANNGAFNEAISTQSHYDSIFRLEKADGTTVWCRTAGDPYYGDNGDFLGYAGYCMDIEEIISGKDALNESQERSRVMIEQAPIGTCLFTGKDMKIEVANDIMLGYWGKDKSVIGMQLHEAMPELTGQPFLDILDEVYTTGIAYDVKSAPAQMKVNGVLSIFYFDFTYKPLRNAKGEVYGIMNMAVDVTEQALARQKIEESQRQLLSYFEQSPVGIALISEGDLVFTMANPFYGQLVGRLPDEFIGKSLLEAIPEMEGQGFDRLLNDVIRTGVPYIANEVAVRVDRENGLEVIYVDLVYQPRYNDDKIVGVLVVALDVTQQVLSRREVESSEAKLRSIIATAPAGMVLFTGREMIIELPNQTFVDILGKGWGIEGMPLREAMPELLTEDQPFIKILENIFDTGETYITHAAPVKIVKNGLMTNNYYNITYSPLFDENNEVYAILDISIDVTDAVLARQKAEDAKTALNGAIELAELATWNYDIKNKQYNYSPRFMDWLGLDHDLLESTYAYSPIPSEFRDEVQQKIDKAVTTGSSGLYENEHPVINVKTGQQRIIHAQAQVFYDGEGNPELLSGTAQDVTKERELQRQLEFQVQQRTEELQAANGELAEANNALQVNNQELEQFAYITSHDLQEPVRKISIFSRMLNQTLENATPRQVELLSKIDNSANRMGNLIRDVLRYSVLSKDAEVFERTDLNKVAGETVTDFELIIEQLNATIKYSNLPEIEAIPLQMSQLFSNLISNSLKYSRPDVSPVINISAKLIESEGMEVYEIEFTDNGIGFNQEYAEKIFNIFQRLHSKGEYTGTGIGLAMCKKIMSNHNGDIRAIATEGEGAKFILTLPSTHLHGN